MKRTGLSPIARLLAFRGELVALWRAFFAPETPFHLKALMLLVPLYLVSPIDLIPDVVPLFGWLDDMVVVPLLVSWIFRMLPQPVRVHPERGSKVIDGTARRL
jgi:uncharacterized membrane protein YkvA (DUF1232 family)